MSDRKNEGVPFDLDAALADLQRDERTARPEPSPTLIARVRADAAEIAAAARPAVAPVVRPGQQRPFGWLRLIGFGDAWAGATVTAVVLVLAVGFGVGYEAGPEVLAATGLDAALGGDRIVLADAGDGVFGSEDAL